MYQMKSTDISIIIIIEMYRKQQNYILRTVLIVFLILYSSALKVDLSFVKKIETNIIVILSIIKEKYGRKWFKNWLYQLWLGFLKTCG